MRNPWTTKELQWCKDMKASGKTAREVWIIHNNESKYPKRTLNSVRDILKTKPEVKTYRCKYTEEMDSFLIENSNKPRPILRELFNERFGTSVSTVAIAQRLANKGHYWIERYSPAHKVVSVRGRVNEE